MPTFGELFAGIGGLSLGLERAGWQCSWQVENDPFCIAVLERHWPDITRYGDIRQVDWRGVEPVELLAGGFPCQPVSEAGRQKAQADERWLWPEFARAVRCLRPQWVLVENVPGLLFVNGGAAADEVFGELAQLGYRYEWASVPAAAVGAPHLRYRVFIVAHADDSRRVGRARQFGQGRGAEPEDGGGALAVADADVAGLEGPRIFRHPPTEGGTEPPHADWWAVEPGMGRVAHGVPGRVDRLRTLGNAVVPQVAEWVGRRLMEAYVSGGGST